MTISQAAPPLVRVDFYSHDAVVHCSGAPPQPPPEGAARGAIGEWSYRSRRNLAFQALNSPATWRSMLTLTYQAERGPKDGKRAKSDLNRYLTGYRGRVGGEYLWFLEFTKRGVPHFHILSDQDVPAPVRYVRSGSLQNRSLTLRECNAWTSATQIRGKAADKMRRASVAWERGRSPGGLARYAVKYAMKMEQKVVPLDYQNVGRFWGMSRAAQARPVQSFDVPVDILTEKSEHNPFATFEQNGNRIPYYVQYGLNEKLKRVRGVIARAEVRPPHA